MDYRNLFREENEAVEERYNLVMDRISALGGETAVKEPFRDYFIKTARFIVIMKERYAFLIR